MHFLCNSLSDPRQFSTLRDNKINPVNLKYILRCLANITGDCAHCIVIELYHLMQFSWHRHSDFELRILTVDRDIYYRVKPTLLPIWAFCHFSQMSDGLSTSYSVLSFFTCNLSGECFLKSCAAKCLQAQNITFGQIRSLARLLGKKKLSADF